MKSLLIATALVLALPACKKTAPEAAATLTTPPPTATTKPVDEQAAANQLVENFQRVFFETDSSRLDTGSQDALRANARILEAFPRIEIEVQGHADERGTIDYNLALGQRRGESVVDFLRREGVAPSRLKIVSYGEERPLDRSNGTSAWAKNRRAEFRVLTGDAQVAGTVTTSGRPVGGP
ncbi:MAG: OmpA family protein [Myxococcota bacterium]